MVHFSGLKQVEKKDHDVIPFKEMLKIRRREASKSLLVEVENQNRVVDLYDYVRGLGKIQMMYHYISPENSHYVLIEMEDENNYFKVLEDAQPADGLVGGSPSNILWFKPSKNLIQQNENRRLSNVVFNASVQAVDDNSKFDYFNESTNLGLRMVELYKKSRIDDLGFRLRFLTCKQIEDAISSINSSLRVLPFGSSVNGFGNMGGDLDMVGLPGLNGNKSNSCLIYHGKKVESERAREQIHISLMNYIMKHILPGCVDPLAIPNASVPILKYRQKQTCLECDLSLYRRDSIIMSELLYFFASVDSRIRPIVFFLRYWAKKMHLTHETPGSHITNFQLVLLVIFFLQQQITNGVSFLPPVEELLLEKDTLMSSKVFHDLRQKFHNYSSENQKSLEKLLLEFFQFYSEFDFNIYGVSLKSGKLIKKSMNHNKSIFIENPLSPELNVSKNVSSVEVTKIQNSFAFAFSTLNQSLRENEIDGLSYLKISDLIQPDHKKDGIEEVKDANEEKYDKMRRLQYKSFEGIEKRKDGRNVSNFENMEEDLNDLVAPARRKDNINEEENLNEEFVKNRRSVQDMLREIENDNVGGSVKTRDVLKLNFKELIEDR